MTTLELVIVSNQTVAALRHSVKRSPGMITVGRLTRSPSMKTPFDEPASLRITDFPSWRNSA
jgi:hypothetical protein